MRPVWLILGLMGWAVSVGEAQPGRFPYEAVVDVDEDYVRCGPGPKYYPTSKLRRGDKIVVHRHDPGGWAMVAPPSDSFSWIQSEYVQKGATGRGALTSNNVIVHVGSNLGDERSVYQRMLSKGDSVEVLGEQTFVTERGPVKMYKIKPPPREYRWVAGKSIVPANGRPAAAPPVNIPAPNNKPIPFIQGPIAEDLSTEVADPSVAFEPSPFGPAVAESSPGAMGTPAKTVASTQTEMPLESAPVENASLEGLRQQLAQLDQQFRATLQNEPQTWDLDALQASYTALEQQAQHPAFTRHVQQRLATLQRYRKIQDEYKAFLRLTSETQQRDAQLQARQRENDTRLQMLASAPVTSPGPMPQPGFPPGPGGESLNPAMAQMQPGPTPLAAPGPAPAPMAAPAGAPTPALAASLSTPPGNAAPMTSQPPQPAPGQKFSGAGIVQRSSIQADGVPGYMLMSPDGRLLAYLEAAPGIDLAGAQNQALGIIGDRNYQEGLKSDVIVVRGFQPVVLRTVLR